jgi:hypothetical protein
MGLSRAKIHQIGTLSAQLGGFGGHGHGCGDFNTADAVGKDFRGGRDCHNSSIFTDLIAAAKSVFVHPTKQVRYRLR